MVVKNLWPTENCLTIPGPYFIAQIGNVVILFHRQSTTKYLFVFQ